MTDEFDVIVERELFLEAVRMGTPPDIAAYEVGWTPKRLEREMNDLEFQELFEQSITLRDSSVEHTLYKMAMRGNQRAIEMWLYNRTPERWKDTRTLKVEQTTGELPQHVIAATVEAIRGSLADAIRSGNIAALQAAPLPIIDAEVVDDGDSGQEAQAS